MNSLSPAAIAVLSRATKLPGSLTLPPGRLAKSLYDEINAALQLLGGQWKTGQQAHVFRKPYLELLLPILDGTAALPPKNGCAYFPTPQWLADEVMRASKSLVALPWGARVLEPSVGRAALVVALRKVRTDLVIEACEIDPENRAAIQAQDVAIIAEDFLTLPDDPVYDAVILNPPFSIPGGDKHAWVTHLEKVMRVLKPGGTVVGIVPQAIEFKGTKRIAALRDIFLAGGRIVATPDKAFVESGTATKTVTVYLGKGERPLTVAEFEAHREDEVARSFRDTCTAVRLLRTEGSHAEQIAFRSVDRTIAFPKATELAELFSGWGPYVAGLTPVERDAGPSYCVAGSTPFESSLSACLRPEVWAQVYGSLVVQDDPGCFLELISHDDHWTVVYFRHNKIIGSRIIGVVATSSLGVMPALILAQAA